MISVTRTPLSLTSLTLSHATHASQCYLRFPAYIHTHSLHSRHSLIQLSLSLTHSLSLIQLSLTLCLTYSLSHSLTLSHSLSVSLTLQCLTHSLTPSPTTPSLPWTFLAIRGELVWFRKSLATSKSKLSHRVLSCARRRHSRGRGHSLSDADSDADSDYSHPKECKSGDLFGASKEGGSTQEQDCDLSEMLFLDIAWLMDAIKSVLDHRLRYERVCVSSLSGVWVCVRWVSVVITKRWVSVCVLYIIYCNTYTYSISVYIYRHIQIHTHTYQHWHSPLLAAARSTLSTSGLLLGSSTSSYNARDKPRARITQDFLLLAGTSNDCILTWSDMVSTELVLS